MEGPRVSFIHEEAEPLVETSVHHSATPGRDPPEWWYNQAASREVSRLLWWGSGLAQKPRQKYSTPVKSYNFYCAMNGINPAFPATFLSLGSWVASLSAKRVETKSIEAYLTGVRSAHVDMGFEDLKVFHSAGLKRVLDGTRRLRGT